MSKMQLNCNFLGIYQIKKRPLGRYNLGMIIKKMAFQPFIYKMVAQGGIEPPTQGFSVLCSTN